MNKDKRNVIITCSDSRDGDFLADHWLASLVHNVNLTNIDIVILDYGLTDPQRKKLERSSHVRLVTCAKDGRVVILRFRDMAAFLRENSYAQVMSCDGGDIIFQSDISDLFENHPNEFRAACQDYGVPIDEVAALKNTIDPVVSEDIRRHYTTEKKMINAGLLLGTRDSFIELGDFVYTHTRNKYAFGADQILVNYIFYKKGFFELDIKYNFILYSSIRSFSIRNGTFMDDENKVIPIVHNAGRLAALRVIRNFGYGPDRNNLKVFRYHAIRFIVRMGEAFRQRKSI